MAVSTSASLRALAPTSELSVYPFIVNEAVSELSACPVMAKEAINKLSACPVMALEAPMNRLMFQPQPWMLSVNLTVLSWHRRLSVNFLTAQLQP